MCVCVPIDDAIAMNGMMNEKQGEARVLGKPLPVLRVLLLLLLLTYFALMFPIDSQI